MQLPAGLLVDLNWPSMLNPPESCKDPQVIAVSPPALSGFLDPAAPKKLMARLQRLANRAELSTEEVHILRGIARAIDERCR